jgi:hypothetical protein
VLVDGREAAALGNHPGVVGGDDLGAHRSFHQLANLLDDLPRIAALLRHQRRLVVTPSMMPSGTSASMLFEISGVDEDLHD